MLFPPKNLKRETCYLLWRLQRQFDSSNHISLLQMNSRLTGQLVPSLLFYGSRPVDRSAQQRLRVFT